MRPKRRAAKQSAANSQGFINTYNAANPTTQYGTSAYQFDPTQPFGTPQPPPAQAPDPELIAAQAQTARQTGYADAQATFDTGRINRDFGYDAKGGIDPSNPYSRAALLQRNFKQQQLGTTNSMAAQGQLYSGANQNAHDANAHGYLVDSNNLRNQYTDALGQTTLNQTGAYANAGANLTPEILASIQRALGK